MGFRVCTRLQLQLGHAALQGRRSGLRVPLQHGHVRGQAFPLCSQSLLRFPRAAQLALGGHRSCGRGIGLRVVVVQGVRILNLSMLWEAGE